MKKLAGSSSSEMINIHPVTTQKFSEFSKIYAICENTIQQDVVRETTNVNIKQMGTKVFEIITNNL